MKKLTKLLLQLFECTSERYINLCKENKYVLSDFIRKVFQSEKKKIEKNIKLEDFIYLKLCGDNQLLTKERLNDEHVKGLCAALEQDESIKSLDLRYNRITDIGCTYLSNVLKKNKTIVELNIMGNDIKENGAKILGDALEDNSTLRILKMTGNKIGDYGGMQFAQALQINTTLKELDLGECDLEIGSIISFATVLRCNRSLRVLNLDRPILRTQQKEPIVHMENMLYVNDCLKELHLSKYEIRDFGVNRLCDALILNTTLTIIDLSCNRITRDGAKVIAETLKRNPPLKVLDLSYNLIHDQGTRSICKALAGYNSNLKCLSIKSNDIHDQGLISISEALLLNSTLEKIFIWGNHFTSEAIKLFANKMDDYRLMESQTDVRVYSVDGIFQFSFLSNNIDFRKYRYTAPIYGADIPENRSYAIM